MTFPAARRLLLLTALVIITGCAQTPGGEISEAPETPPPVAVTVPETVPDRPVVIPEPPAPEVVTVIEKPAPRDMWERIRGGFAMKPMDGDLVRDWEIRYSAKPEYFARMVDRGSRYLFHIVEEIERRKMPAEIALLPMIESAYNPQAYSKAHASGLWQFIPSTGRNYGLRQNWWYDGRRDVIAATNAALDYLEKLYGMFGDWELALASYNWGEGAVSRAVARNQARGLPGDYASLTMPAETRNYLPKLIAVKNIIADPARFGVQLNSVPNEPYFETVTVREHIDVKLAAKFAEMPLDEFSFLNPAHNKRVIKAYAETIVLPRNRVAIFHANLENHGKPLVSWQAHTLKAGEKPEKVAARYGISVSELKAVNGISGRTTLRPGQPLLVPVKEGTTPNLPDLPATPVTLPRAYKAARATHAKGGKPAKTHAAKANVKRAPAKRATVAIKPPAKPAKPPVVASQSKR
ncbi:MAG: transglycosylase SLT domain-containing protein [Burkholderiales bacterium]|nr:transglycosylase SLT domain-containing protein [Burkholderiales bacterium]